MLFWLNLKDSLKDIGCFVKNAIVELFSSTFSFIRLLLYWLLCVLCKIGILAFIASFYFSYLCYKDFSRGIGFAEMKYLYDAILLFVSPILLFILKELVNPYKHA